MRQLDQDFKLTTQCLNNSSKCLQTDVTLTFHSRQSRLLDSQRFSNFLLRLPGQIPKFRQQHLAQKLLCPFPGSDSHFLGRGSCHQFVE